MYLGVLLDVGHLALNVAFGPYIFTSAHGGTLVYTAAFLSCVIVAIMPDLVRMAFSSR
jgi:hypothetical protein